MNTSDLHRTLRAAVLGALLFIAPSIATAQDAETGVPSSPIDPIAALETGNQLFEAGEFEAAVDAYRQGFDPARPHATLAYNLATALHHAGRLPEAILWYHRGASDDPWTEENLWLARKSLGSQKLPLTGLHGWVERHGSRLSAALIAWVWLACLSAILLPADRVRSAVFAAALGSVCYLALVTTQSFAPRAVVLLEDCTTASGELPAGTEAWASKSESGWEIAGVEQGTCPEGSLALMNP